MRHESHTDELERGVRYFMRQYLMSTDNVDPESMKDTPRRVIKAWDYMLGGYHVDIPSLFTVFEAGDCEQMVVLKDIEFYSTCEHHLLPFFGKAHIGYIPNDKVIGVSKLARLLDAFARRFQIQERIGTQVTQALLTELNTSDAACMIEAQHMCMLCRGVEKQSSIMLTSSVEGVFKSDSNTRQEFLRLIGK